MATAQDGDTVRIDFVVKTADGQVVGSTEGEGPQSVVLGSAQIFPEVEAALLGMDEGSVSQVTVGSDSAFGPRREELVVEIPRINLPPEPEPQIGMQLAARQEDGSTANLIIVAVGEDAVTVDGNHPLAGEDLHFGLTLVEIVAA